MSTKLLLKKKIKKVFSEKSIASRIARLAKQIRKDAGDDEIFLLGILRGASCFLTDLLRALPGDVSYGFVDVVRDMADAEVATAMEIDFREWIDIRGKNVYLLKDVVSTGVIETYLLTQLRQKKPAELKLVALLDHTDMRTIDLQVDYRLFEVERGSFVGYGLELAGKYANLPYIGKL